MLQGRLSQNDWTVSIEVAERGEKTAIIASRGREGVSDFRILVGSDIHVFSLVRLYVINVLFKTYLIHLVFRIGWPTHGFLGEVRVP